MELPTSNRKLVPKFKRKAETSENKDLSNVPEPKNELTEEEKLRKQRKEELERLIQQEEKLQNNENNYKVEEIPDYIRNLGNEQIILSYLRLKKRSNMNGLIELNVEQSDLANENYELFDSKCFNLPSEKFIEENGLKEKYFIESISQNKFFELHQAKDYYSIKENEQASEQTNLTTNDLQMEEKYSYDMQINNALLTISNNISIVFLFAQGILAGLALANILLLYSFSVFKDFIYVFSTSAEIYFNLMHFLTFGSLVGNGSKLVTTHRYLENIKLLQSSSSLLIPRLKRKIIIMHIMFWLLIVAFILELVLTSYIPKIVYSYYTINNNLLLEESEFNVFKSIYLVVDIIVLINYLINVADISRVNDNIIEG